MVHNEEGDDVKEGDAKGREAELEHQVTELREEEAALLTQIEDVQRLMRNRVVPLEERLREVRAEAMKQAAELEFVRNPPEATGPPPGPECLHWVEGGAFQCVCNLVIISNLACMGLQLSRHEYQERLWVLDQAFLSWYLVELVLKFALHRCQLLFGKCSIVWWNWLDLGIVFSGVMDQWGMPLLRASAGGSADGHTGHHTSALRALRLLRLFRLMRLLRVLKVLRVFLQADLSWTEGHIFQSFIMGVIVLNSVSMGFELDVPWPGWVWVENVMLAIYVFELAVRLKRWGWKFFVHADDWKWNNVDFVIVSGGVLQQWMLPTVTLVQELASGTDRVQGPPGKLKEIMKILRMLRLLRVMRLVRLLRGIKPLYRLMLGVMEAMSGMQWVLLYTFLLLYAAAIVFTNLVGHGLIYSGDPPEEASEIFGSVMQSFFMLFKLMNDDQSVVEPLITSKPVRGLFVVFMIVSNWAALAILTSVVTDNMNAASLKLEKEETKREKEEWRTKSVRCLKALFAEIDVDQSGEIEEDEFQRLLDDAALRQELCDASGLTVRDLQDLFLCISYVDDNGRRGIFYEDFIDKLQDEGKNASERSIFRLEKQMRAMELRIQKQLKESLSAMGAGKDVIEQVKQLPQHC